MWVINSHSLLQPSMAGAKSYIECAGLPEDLVSLKVHNKMGGGLAAALNFMTPVHV
jgi:hypothetical protein